MIAGATAIAGLFGLLLEPAFAQAQMLWQFDQYRDGATQQETASLTFGVPETDNTQVRATCSGTTTASAQRSRIVFATDTGALKNGEKVRLQFSGGGRSLTVEGRIAGVGNTQERIAGVRLSPKHDSAIWDLLQGAPGVDYFISGYRAAQLDLAEGREVIAEFLLACRSRVNAVQAPVTTPPATASTGAGTGISEKEAFDIAKELGTIGAWEAFLNNFGSGFRADLARAYLANLRGDNSGGNATPQVQPPQQPQQQGNGATAGFPLFVDAGTSPWWNARRRTAYDGGRGEYAASVETGGIEMVTHCHAYGRNRDLTVFLRDAQRRNGGAKNRALRAAALAAPRLRINGAFDNVRRIGITFSDGSTVPGAATNGNDLQSQFFIYANGRAIKARSNVVGQMMSQNSMRITAPNLDVTFQLDGSRAAICSVLNRCGVKRSDCRGVRTQQTVKPTTNRCSGGRFYSRNQKACRCPSRRPVWNGVSCERGQTSCGTNYRLVKGKCVLRQNCGRNAYRNVEGDCFCKTGFVRRNGACVRKSRTKKCTQGRVFSKNRNRCVCPRSARFWYGGRCRPRRECPGDSDLINGICQKVSEGQDSPQRCGKGRTWVGAQGRCVCIDDRRRWNGKRCVLKRKKNSGSQQLSPQQVKQATCNVLKLACAAGSNSSCRKATKNGC